MFKKLRIKLIFTFMVLLTALVSMLLVSFYIVSEKNAKNDQYNQLANVIDKVKGSERQVNTDATVIAYYIPDKSDFTIYSKVEIEQDEFKDGLKKIVESKEQKGFAVIDNHQFSYLIKNTQSGLEIILNDSSYYQESMNKLKFELSMIGLVSLIPLFFLSIIVANAAIKPVEEAYNAQKRFIADASHELKTPIAVINTNLDVLEDNKQGTIASQAKWFNYIKFQTGRMSKLIENLLYLAKSDNNEMLGTVSDFNLSDAITNILLSFEAVAFEKGLKIDYSEVEENIYFKGNKDSIDQLVLILLDNAVKYAYKNSEIKVSLSVKKQKIYFAVVNACDTIQKENIEKLFDRFYRIEESRARQGGGYGLGLSIGKSIVEKNHGKIEVKSQDNKVEFVVEFSIA